MRRKFSEMAKPPTGKELEKGQMMKLIPPKKPEEIVKEIGVGRELQGISVPELPITKTEGPTDEEKAKNMGAYEQLLKSQKEREAGKVGPLPYTKPDTTKINSLLCNFLSWLAEQKDILEQYPERAKSFQKDKVNKTNNDIITLVNALCGIYMRGERILTNDKSNNPTLVLLTKNIRNTGGVEKYIDDWIRDKKPHMTPIEKNTLISIVNNNILLQTIRGGSGKMLTKRRKLSKRLQTKKRRV